MRAKSKGVFVAVLASLVACRGGSGAATHVAGGMTPGSTPSRLSVPVETFFATRIQPSLEFCRSCHVPGGAGDTADGHLFLLSPDKSQDYANYRAAWAAFGQGVEENRILVRTSTPDTDSNNGLGKWPKDSAPYNNSKILFTCWNDPAGCDTLLAQEMAADTVAIGAVDCTANDCATVGGFTPPFKEPRITQGGPASEPDCALAADGVTQNCKPAAVHVALLGDNRILYYNGLEGSEQDSGGGFSGGTSNLGFKNDQSRLLTISGDTASWSWPTPVDGLDYTSGKSGDSAWFCSDLSGMPDGQVAVAGGTDYFGEPGVDSTISLLAGIKHASFFNALSDTWTRIADMLWPRWYPTSLAMPDGKLLVVGGAAQLTYPIYPDNPTSTGRNLVQSETYDPVTGRWTDNGAAAERSLPLYPRLHLLPNGHVYYNGAGEAWNPGGAAYDQLGWNFVATYDPVAGKWTDLGFAGLPSGVNLSGDPVSTLGAGFRGSTFSLMLPLMPDDQGRYTKAEFLTAGGVLGAPLLVSPGSYLATAFSRIDTVDLSGGDEHYSSRATGPLKAPRWFGTGVLLPTGEAIVFSGSDRDEVLVPASGNPVLVSELFDPVTATWKPMAKQSHPRTYHNTALLLPDGRVLVGGHAPLAAAQGQPMHDPTFELYSPPYIFRARPVISSAPTAARPAALITVGTPQAGTIESVVLMRRTTLTHVVDAEQRSVVLRIVSRSSNTLQLQLPDMNVVPSGAYLLFINQRVGAQLTPSVSVPVKMG